MSTFGFQRLLTAYCGLVSTLPQPVTLKPGLWEIGMSFLLSALNPSCHPNLIHYLETSLEVLLPGPTSLTQPGASGLGSWH